MKRRATFGLLTLAALGGCICPPPPPKVLQPSISSAQHLSNIDARSRQIQTLRARGKVAITYTNKDGKEHQDTAGGVLLLKRVELATNNGAQVYYKVLLFGRVAEQDVFELGENDKTFWMASRIDPKTAHVAKKVSPLFADPGDTAGDAMPIRAGKIPFLLGIAPPEVDSIVVTNSETVSVITMIPESGRRIPHAQVELSRYAPGDPIAVRLYNPDGAIEGEAQLSDYTAVGAVRLPHKIVVTYPARKAKIELTIDTPGPLTQEGYELNPALKDAAFLLPDFERQGLKVNPGKAP
jgi:hypothetical protein